MEWIQYSIGIESGYRLMRICENTLIANKQLLGLEWIKYLPDTQLLFFLSIASLLGGYLVYRSSLFLHAQFGESFKSLFDIYRNKVSVEDIIDEIASITDDPTYKVKSPKEKYKIAWRYLHNYRIRIGDRLISPADYQGKSEQVLIIEDKKTLN
jgi:hypothetical protein